MQTIREAARARESTGNRRADDAWRNETLDLHTPFGSWIRRQVLPKLGVGLGPRPSGTTIVRSRLTSSHRAVRASVRDGNREIASFILKEYYRDPGISPRDAAVRARREIRAYRLMEQHGLHEGAGRVPNLLAARSREPAALAIEHVDGVDLATLLKQAARAGSADGRAFRSAAAALTGTAALLARFHAVAGPPIRIWRSRLRRYPFKLLHALALDEVLGEKQYRLMASQLDHCESMLADPAPRLVHGDANPTNFLVRPDGQVVALDLERLGACHPALDLGFLVADVIHLTRQYGGPADLARRLVAAFRRDYAEAAGVEPEGHRDGLFLAMGLWRIARNGWLTRKHRRWLLAVSGRVLRGAVRDAALDESLWQE